MEYLVKWLGKKDMDWVRITNLKGNLEFVNDYEFVVCNKEVGTYKDQILIKYDDFEIDISH